jgi:sensor histidine kinase YesM
MDVRANGKISEMNVRAERDSALTMSAVRTQPASSAPRPHRGYWLCQIAGWLVVFLVNVSFTLAAPSPQILAYVLIFGTTSLAGMALSHRWRHMLKQRGWLIHANRTPWLAFAGWIVLFGLMLLIVASAMFYLVRPAGMARGYAWVPAAATFWILAFASWTACYAFALSRRRAAQLEQEHLRLEVLAKDAELRALQSQVNPHFFFNSLNSLRALIYENPNAAAGMVDQLAALMRHTLASSEKKVVPLKTEIEAVRAYLAIEQIRFEERLRVHIDIAPDCEQQAIPPMALQTLVENAVKHGVERHPAGSDVDISAVRAAGYVEVRVTNRGAVGLGGDSTRVGIANTEKRLALLLGADASLNLTERDGRVTATLSLPVA